MNDSNEAAALPGMGVLLPGIMLFSPVFAGYSFINQRSRTHPHNFEAARKKRLAEQASGPVIDWDEVLAEAEGEVEIYQCY